ncbi:hypothetical protein Runsl_4285 [Runella slithyformis DSM 19594]|uniref:Uncharacterized protein n=1 Tax=Runella slithyformis (strain ATCC 29530 / DSM 19594 / LMG 11500 / NCIMB 11436 / LSU 4) TaxID=761193 RepID=A0A7U4E7W7_RUNSL|nr:hypothetical protein Runsl_4285 [Runella slithyformis DSM 19594]
MYIQMYGQLYVQRCVLKAVVTVYSRIPYFLPMDAMTVEENTSPLFTKRPRLRFHKQKIYVNVTEIQIVDQALKNLQTTIPLKGR